MSGDSVYSYVFVGEKLNVRSRHQLGMPTPIFTGSVKNSMLYESTNDLAICT